MLHLFLFGNVDLVSDTGASMEAPLRRSKRVALLAYLAVARPTGFHRRDKVAALFWPELPGDRARAALRTTVSRLRDDHGAELFVSRGADEIALDSTRLRCDVLEFDAACRSSRHQEAVDLYRGPFLDGVHVEGAGEELENWIAAERFRLREGLLLALAALAGDAEKRSDLGAAVTAARLALEVSPHDEVLARRVIALLVASGNRGSAMHVHDEFVRRLRSELGVEPAAETEALVAPLRERSVRAFDAPATDAARSDAGPARDHAPWRASGATHLGLAGLVGVALLMVSAVMTAVWLVTRDRGVQTTVAGVHWQRVTPVGEAAAASFGSRAVLDSTGDALLVFGGVLDLDRKRLVPLGQTYWRLRGLESAAGASWTRLTPAAGPHPTPRWLFGVSYDARYDRVILHGGALGFTSPCTNDTWVLSHASGIGRASAWKRVRIRGQLPPARAAFEQVYDQSRRRLIVFAGNDCVFPSFHDTWVLAFDDSTLASGTWSQLVPDSSAGLPLQRDAYAAAYDTLASRLFIYGGRAATVPTGEIWTLEHASGNGSVPAWRPLRCDGEHPALMGPASALDFQSDTWTFFGGVDANAQHSRAVWRVHGLLRDAGHCRWEQVIVPEPSPAARVGAGAALLANARGIVIFGGDFGNTALADAWVLKPTARR